VSLRPKPKVRGHGGSLSLGNELGRGGEGTVYEIPNNPNLVAKVYHKPITSDRAAKIEAMASMKTDRLLSLTAWPVELLYSSNGDPCGLLMPKLAAHKDIHHLYSPKGRKIEFPNADWRFLIRATTNTARAFAVIHESGCVIGDVNHGGITVSEKATVKLIDCDSFQVSYRGRTYSCEVGVPDFTPPELQGKSLKGVVRTKNQDNFGLAVLAFRLLFMGRHPFAGRFLGSGEMPIERAIAEFRFPYGSGRGMVQMVPPPNAPEITSASMPIALLLERAFARTSVSGSRPTAQEWITALEVLEKQLRQCPTNASHHYFSGAGFCPWCRLEATTGVMLFNAFNQNYVGIGSSFDIDLAWRKITSIQPPGPAPTLIDRQDLRGIKPCPEAANAVGRPLMRWLGATLIAAAFTGLCLAFPKIWFIWLPVGFFLASAVINKKSNSQAVETFATKFHAAEAQYRTIKDQWEKYASEQRYVAKLRELEVLRDQWRSMPSTRQRRYSELEQQRQMAQKMRFLERFTINRATIAGIGPGRKAMLESYNIENAWDVSERNISPIPGFGPALTAKLLDWRISVERKFRYDPSIGVDPRDVAALDRDIAEMKQKIEAKLLAGPNQLNQIRSEIMSQRNALKGRVNDAYRALVQTEVDLMTIKS